MKKKGKDKKKPDMPDFTFKEFTPEEGALYEDAVNKFREAVAAGKTLRQAYETRPVADKELEKIIQADFLKILIAERHFGQRQALEDLARGLDVSLELIKDTVARMLQEAGVSAANQFGREYGGIIPKTSD
jgi:hypothetical protein